MINKNHAEDIRTCQRVKFDQALYILTMYEKKIRKIRKNIQAPLDTQAEMQDIMCAWKNKWKMDLTKPILNCVTSVYPRVLIDLGPHDHSGLRFYYQMMAKFISRLRAQHQDQTNFKLIMQGYDRTTQGEDSDKYLQSAKATVKGLLETVYKVTDSMVKTLGQSEEQLSEGGYPDVSTDRPEWQAVRPLRFMREMARKAKDGQDAKMDMEDESNIEPMCQKTANLVAFTANIIKLMEKIKESEHGSTLITVQPKIDQLTYMFHPLLAAISANFKKENLQKQKDYDWRHIQVDSIPMMENTKSSYNFSKVAFINLDGYQSEFNLQFARNYKKHLLYVSFPKQDSHLDGAKLIYQKRFFKKLMFKYTQATYQSFNQEYMGQDYQNMIKEQQLSYNPQNYHCNINKLYQRKGDKSMQDFNQNLYVFPIRMSIFREAFPQIMQMKEDIQSHQSHFIRFIVKDFLLNQIRQFNPTLIIISYSGRLQIEDQHFVELMQQFTKIANYKLMFFPNFTTQFCSESSMTTQDIDGQECDYDNFIDYSKKRTFFQESNDFCSLKTGLSFGESQKQMVEQKMQKRDINYENWIQIFNKIARFLKISSGTYNLSRNFDEQSLVSKYKNQYILTYTDELMTVLGKQYSTIDRIRFRNKDLSIIPKLFQQNMKSIKKAFDKTVPKFYFQMYQIIEYLIFDRRRQTNQAKQDLIAAYKLKVQNYEDELQNLYYELRGKSNYQTNAITSSQNINQTIQKAIISKMNDIFKNLKDSHLFEISSEKLVEKCNIYIKTEQQNKQYMSLIDDQASSIKGLYQASFFINPGKNNLKIYESTKILYKTDQSKRRSDKIPILIMNNIPQHQSGMVCFQNYYTQLDISGTYQNLPTKSVQQKRCLVFPIVFRDQNGKIEDNRNVYAKSEWNFHQTDNYIILYWPNRFDFLRAFLFKLMNKPYQPQIMNQFYLFDKRQRNGSPVFQKKLIAGQDRIAPRVGTSCYQFANNIYIFGGFYQRQKNYLELQHDIMYFDLQQYEMSQKSKISLKNMKNLLFSRETMKNAIANHQKPNSFVRPRMEFQFYELQELMDENMLMNDDRYKVVIMFGGYGQNFIRPFSMLTYYYYELKFDRNTRQLHSIEKKLIYNKAVPINTKQMTKNLGIIRTNKKTKGGILQPNRLTQPQSYTMFRNSFKLEKNAQDRQFSYKFKYMFSEQQLLSHKIQIQKIQQLKTEEFDSSPISVEKMIGNSHVIVLQKDGKRWAVTLHMEIPFQKARKLDCGRQVKLTHQSIVCIDIWNSVVCAIVRHQFYTGGKSVLLEYNIKTLETLNFSQDQIPHISMTWLRQFDCDLSLHGLIVCNKNTIAILHGQKVQYSQKIKEFIVKKKKGKNEVAAFQIHKKQPFKCKDQSIFINSIFFKHRSKILSYDFVAFQDSNILRIKCQEIELAQSQQFKWCPCSQNESRIDCEGELSFCISQKRIIPMSKLRFLQFYKNQNEMFLQIDYKGKNYICELSKLRKIGGISLIQLVQEKEMALDKQNMERGIILVKNEETYIDRNFVE